MLLHQQYGVAACQHLVFALCFGLFVIVDHHLCFWLCLQTAGGGWFTVCWTCKIIKVCGQKACQGLEVTAARSAHQTQVELLSAEAAYGMSRSGDQAGYPITPYIGH